MFVKIFTVYDSKTEAYLQPFYEPSIGGALRNFEEAANDPESPIHKYSADFTLFLIGEFDNSNANFEIRDTPKSLALASELKRPTIPETKPELINRLEQEAPTHV